MTAQRILTRRAVLRMAVLSVGASSAVLLAACDDDQQPEPAAPKAAAPAAAPKAEAPAAAPKAEAPAAARGEIAREDTFIQTAFGPGVTQFDDPGNSNPYSLGGLGRVRAILNNTIYEYLYLYNHNNGEIIPWLAESFTPSPDFTSVDVTLREGVEWSDGTPFTSEDVKFTVELLRDSADLTFAADMKEWVKEVVVQDPRHFTFVLNKPNSRFFYFFFAENSEIHITILPKHIWEGKDPTSFKYFDLEKGWPVGTGPYKMVDATSGRMVFDRRDDWWGAEVGFQRLPEPLRVIYVPPGSADTSTTMLINNEVDMGARITARGIFEAAQARNPNIVSWNPEGPVWGAQDACGWTLGMNNATPPFDDLNVRWAINHATDRQRFVDVGYEGSVPTLVLPYATFDGLLEYVELHKALLDKYNVDDPDLAKVDERMTAAGYEKDAEGFWAKDGERLSEALHVPGWAKLGGPILEKMLRDAGFDITMKVYEPDTGPFFDAVRSGTANIWHLIWCGSSREPWGTLRYYHSKFASPIGTPGSFIWANTNYSNPEYDAIIDEMDGLVPSPDSPEYVDLANRAVEIYLRDLPELTVGEQLHIITYNNTYWKGFPNSENPYVAPYSLWAGTLLVLLNVTKA